jgi:hypothetical protein
VAQSHKLQHVERALAAVCDRQLRALDTDPGESLGECGSGFARAEDALEAARRCERAQVRPR